MSSVRICSVKEFADSLCLDMEILKDGESFLKILDSLSHEEIFTSEINLEMVHFEKGNEDNYWPGWFKIGSSHSIAKHFVACLERNIYRK